MHIQQILRPWHRSTAIHTPLRPLPMSAKFHRTITPLPKACIAATPTPQHLHLVVVFSQSPSIVRSCMRRPAPSDAGLYDGVKDEDEECDGGEPEDHGARLRGEMQAETAG